MTHTEREPKVTICRTCGFSDCPSIDDGGPCPRWTAADNSPSDAELEARADDLYTTIMAALDSLPAATWTPEYREAKRQVQAMEIEFRAVCLELSTRLHARSVAWNELPDLTRPACDCRSVNDQGGTRFSPCPVHDYA